MIDLRSAEVILHIRRCVEYVEILIGNGLFFSPNVEPTLAAKGEILCSWCGNPRDLDADQLSSMMQKTRSLRSLRDNG